MSFTRTQQQQQQQQPPPPEQAQEESDDHHHTLSLAFQTYLRHDKEEQAHWEDVCRAYRQYATFALCHWNNQNNRVSNLKPEYAKYLPPGLLEGTKAHAARQQAYQEAYQRNQFCLDCILRHSGMPHSQQQIDKRQIATDRQISKVSSVLKSLVRDWSAEGKPERDMAYQPILDGMHRHLPVIEGRAAPRVCVPGAGVGRLALELTSLGYAVQGNEFSLYMLLASDFVLNSGLCHPQKPFHISPWLLESRNVHAPEDPTRKISIPDISPASVLGSADFSMAAGDFCTIYRHDREVSQWDAVASCFFLDAAPNVVEYLLVIHKMLKPGGILLNFGPLLYHFSGPAMRPDDVSLQSYRQRFSFLDPRFLESVDLCWKDVSEILQNIGFTIVEERVGIKALYTADRKSMMNMNYRCIQFVAKKK